MTAENKDKCFETLVKETRTPLSRSLGRMLAPAQCEEVMQEAYLKVFIAMKKSKIEEPKALLFRTSRNLAISRLRHQKVVRQSAYTITLHQQIREAVPSAEQQLSDRQDLRILLDAVNLLPPSCKQVFILRKVEGLDHSEIAEQLGITTNTVKNHLSKGMKLCRAHIVSASVNTLILDDLPRLKLVGRPI